MYSEYLVTFSFQIIVEANSKNGAKERAADLLNNDMREGAISVSPNKVDNVVELTNLLEDKST